MTDVILYLIVFLGESWVFVFQSIFIVLKTQSPHQANSSTLSGFTSPSRGTYACSSEAFPDGNVQLIMYSYNSGSSYLRSTLTVAHKILHCQAISSHVLVAPPETFWLLLHNCVCGG